MLGGGAPSPSEPQARGPSNDVPQHRSCPTLCLLEPAAGVVVTDPATHWDERCIAAELASAHRDAMSVDVRFLAGHDALP